MANRCSHDYLLERMSFKCGSHLFSEWENNLWILNSVSEWTFYMIIGRWTREICSWFPRYTSCLLWLGQITEDIFLFSLWVPGIPLPLLFVFLSTSFFSLEKVILISVFKWVLWPLEKINVLLNYIWVLNFVKGFLCIYWDNHMVFLFQIVNVVYYIDLQILKNPCIPGIKPTWSSCMIFLMCCRIVIARILLRIFASMFISDIGL